MVCRCGTRADDTALCPHCDRATTCEPGCVACRTRDSICIICGTNCGAPVAATIHERECRRREGSRS